MKKIIDFFRRLFNKSDELKSEPIENKIKDEPIKEESKITESAAIINKENKICPNCSGDIKNGKVSATNEFGEYYICCNSCGFVSKIVNGKIISPPNTVREAIKAQILFKEKNLNPAKYSMNNSKDLKQIELLKEAYRYNKEG